MRIKNILSLAVFVAILGGLLYGLANLQAISDWLRLRNYDPPARIARIADDTTMDDGARRLFYVNQPELGDKVTFNQHCRTTEESIVLGCFIEGQGIFLLDVKDERLSGVIEVTAAHELLHAAYERLGRGEQERVDRMTAEFFVNLKDKRIRETVDNYRNRDPSIVPNELHSILGTEVRELNPELEEYYKQYFKDRQKIVQFSEQYEQTFTNLRAQVDQYDVQLMDLKAQIESSQAEIDAANSELQAERARLDQLLASGENEDYNDRVPGYNQQVAEYNRLINHTKQLISTYNSIVEKRNALATVEQELVEAIDSSQLTTQERE